MPKAEGGRTGLGWDLGHGVRAAFSVAADGDLHDRDRRNVFAAGLGIDSARLAVPRQIHSAAVVEADPSQVAVADGLATGDAGIAVGVFGADCPGIVLAAPDALGAAHCGWRGTAAGMAAALCAAMHVRSRRPPAAWTALIGPGICAACYEVDEPVLAARIWPPGALRPGRDAAHAQLDLATALTHDLRSAGIGTVRTCGICTRCDARLHSYRANGGGLAQLLVAWRGQVRPEPG